VLDNETLPEDPSVTSTAVTASAMYTGLLRDPPEVDYAEWQQHLSTTQLQWAKSELHSA
jgi:hypothetical protein